MDEVTSLHYDETPKAKTLRYIIWGLVAVFVITVTIMALVDGFSSGQQGFAFLGIACFLFSLTTFYMQFRIVKGDLPDSARFPVYLQLAFVVFFGVSILLTVYSNWHPEELNCYYDDPGTFVRSSGNPRCWKPPSCYRSSSQCMMYITAGGVGDHCALNTAVPNATSGATTYTCSYTYHPPTPRPTVNPSPGPPGPQEMHSNNIESFAAGDDYNNAEYGDILDYLYSNYWPFASTQAADHEEEELWD